MYVHPNYVLTYMFAQLYNSNVNKRKTWDIFIIIDSYLDYEYW